MIALLALALMQGQGPLQVELRVDRERVHLDEEILVTVRAESGIADPIAIAVPTLDGFELVGRSERREVSQVGPVARSGILELRLRATRVGSWVLGPARATQGGHTAETPPVTIIVTGQQQSAASQTPSLNPRVRELLARAPPPPPGDRASLTILTSSDNVVVGEQVDVVTAAWFPRELRLQLRRPPTLEVPSVDGVWSYPQRSPPGIAASRQVNGRWYDLFIVHQVVFPLTAGTVTVGSASLQYSVPRAFQFFSQDEPYSMRSPVRKIRVRPLPDAGRPAGFLGAVGHGLEISRRLEPTTLHAGEPVTVSVSVKGQGNVALWPDPDLAWPAGIRAYEDRTDDRIEMANGEVGGAKTFRYVAVPDSAGTVTLPAIRYPYYDPDRGYTSASAPAAVIAVAPERDPEASRATPPALLAGADASPAWRLLHGPPAWAWWLLALLLPASYVLVWWRREHGTKSPAPTPAAGGLRGVELELERTLRALLGEAASHDPGGVVAALRAAGVSEDLAREAVRVRQAISARRYGPSRGEDIAVLTGEARALIRRLHGASPRRRRVASIALVGLLVLLGTPARGQAPDAEALYRSGALRAASDSFAGRASRRPEVAAHWYNLGAVRYRMGSDGWALASWAHARRLAPRNGTIRRALRTVPPPDGRSASLLAAAPVTPEELWLLALLCWATGWGVAIVTRRLRRGAAWVLIVVAVVLGTFGLLLQRWYDRPVVVVVTDQPVRVSPHGLATPVAQAPHTTAVRVVHRQDNWSLVRLDARTAGWVPSDQLAPVSP